MLYFFVVLLKLCSDNVLALIGAMLDVRMELSTFLCLPWKTPLDGLREKSNSRACVFSWPRSLNKPFP